MFFWTLFYLLADEFDLLRSRGGLFNFVTDDTLNKSFYKLMIWIYKNYPFYNQTSFTSLLQ